MAVASEQNALSTSAELIVTATGSAERVKVRNDDASISVFLGPSGVTSSNGFEVAAATSVDLVLMGGETLYAVAASGTPTVHILRTNV